MAIFDHIKPAYNPGINATLSQSHPSYYRIAALKEFANSGPPPDPDYILDADGEIMLDADGNQMPVNL